MKIRVRGVELEDAEALKEIYEGVSAYSATLQLPMPSTLLWKERLSNIPDNLYSYVALDGELVVGNLGLEVARHARRRHVASLGMAVRDDSHQKGVGTALMETALDMADNWLNLGRVELTVFTDNEPAIKLYKKFGFEIEGEAKDYAFRNGEYVPAYYMARCASGV